MRQIIIGDVHGCYRELQELLNIVGTSTDDEIIALGDLVDRGPNSLEVLNYFSKQFNSKSIMGNHERKHIRSFHSLIEPAISQCITRQQFSNEQYEKAILFMKSFPTFIELPEVILVHGYFEPNIPLNQQQEHIIIGTLKGDLYLKRKFQRPWYELYDENKPIIVGHHDYKGDGKPLIFKNQVFCIDTGCCRGRALTCITLPDFNIFSVKSHCNYWQIQKSKNLEIVITMRSEESLSWKDIELLKEIAKKRLDLSQKAKEQLSKLKPLINTANNALNHLFNFVVQKNEQIIDQLCIEASYEKLTPNEQGRIYAASIGNTPLATLLHLARKNNLTLDILYKRFKKPINVIKFTERINLLTEKTLNDK